MEKSDGQQNDSHDWFADVAENYVRYLAAKAGLDVFAGGKWTADAVFVDRKSKKMWRVEVRSKDSNNKPTDKDRTKTDMHADVVVHVNMPEAGCLVVKWYRVGNDGKRESEPKAEEVDLLSWLGETSERWKDSQPST